jgi:hypothetical protein
MVDEMELLLSPESRKAARPRSLNVILIVDVVIPKNDSDIAGELNYKPVKSQEQMAKSQQ